MVGNGIEEEPQQQLQEQLANQRNQQEQLQRQMTEETQARSKMESQLVQMQKLLEMLVDKQTSVSSSVVEVPVSVSPPITAASAQTQCSGQNITGGGERSSTRTTISNIMPISSVSMSRSTSFCSIPKIMEGISFVDFKQKVMVWRKLISDAIPPEKTRVDVIGRTPYKRQVRRIARNGD